MNEFRYSDTHQDGLLDIFIGLCALLAGLFMMTDMIYLVGIVPAIFLPGWQSVRRKSLQRQGVSEIPGSQQFKTRMFFLVVLLLGFLSFTATLGMGVVVYFDQIPVEWFAWIEEYSLIVLGTVFAGLMAFSAWMTGIRRLYAYALLMLLAFLFAYQMGIGLPWLIVGFGLVILTCGGVLLVRFFNNYPSR